MTDKTSEKWELGSEFKQRNKKKPGLSYTWQSQPQINTDMVCTLMKEKYKYPETQNIFVATNQMDLT